MGKKSGKIFKWITKQGEEKIGIAYDKDQVEQFTKYGKLALIEVDKNHKPTGIRSVKNQSQLTLVGFVD